jgi:hypothetical protein
MAVHVASMGRRGRIQSFGEKIWERENLGDLSVNWRIILIWISRKWNMRVWPGSNWFKTETGGGHL